jgi:hypothetical protein
MARPWVRGVMGMSYALSAMMAIEMERGERGRRERFKFRPARRRSKFRLPVHVAPVARKS